VYRGAKDPGRGKLPRSKKSAKEWRERGRKPVKFGQDTKLLRGNYYLVGWINAEK